MTLVLTSIRVCLSFINSIDRLVYHNPYQFFTCIVIVVIVIVTKTSGSFHGQVHTMGRDYHPPSQM